MQDPRVPMRVLHLDKLSLIRMPGSDAVLREMLPTPTAGCFKSTRFVQRDERFDRRLPLVQPATPITVVAGLTLSRRAALLEMAATLIHESLRRPVEMLYMGLKSRGYTMTLAQIEQIIEWAEWRSSRTLNMDLYANFAFVNDADGRVSVVRLHRNMSPATWSARLHHLTYDHVWSHPSVLLVPNFRNDLLT
jgi:hypothetical protein